MMKDIHSMPINLDLDREFMPIKSIPLRETWDMPKNNQLLSFLLSPSMSRVASLSVYEAFVWARMVLAAKVFEWLHSLGRDKLASVNVEQMIKHAIRNFLVRTHAWV